MIGVLSGFGDTDRLDFASLFLAFLHIGPYNT